MHSRPPDWQEPDRPDPEWQEPDWHGTDVPEAVAGPPPPDCLTCGGACCRVDWVVAFDQGEHVPAHLSIAGSAVTGSCPDSERRMLRAADGACIALNQGLCSIYELRPTPCREFEPGSEDCLEARAAMATMPIATP